MKYDIRELRARGSFIAEVRHPSLPLLLWNYKPECEWAQAWDDYTRVARGLITNMDGNVVARPFPKFFNLGAASESSLANLPDEQPAVYEKLDGSLGILYWSGDVPCIATRGSFASPIASWATRWLQSEWLGSAQALRRSHTYLFEILHPKNRVVVDYGPRAELVLLGAIEIATGAELDPLVEAARLGFAHPRRQYQALPAVLRDARRLGPEAEGFVLRFSNGLRVKVKGNKYLELHRSRGLVAPQRIWQCLAGGSDIAGLLAGVPDEYFSHVRKVQSELEAEYAAIVGLAQQACTVAAHLPDRRAQAALIRARYQRVAKAAFALLDGKDIRAIAWDMVRPSGRLCAPPARSLSPPLQASRRRGHADFMAPAREFRGEF